MQILQNGTPLIGERVGLQRSTKRHLPPLAAVDGEASTASDQALLRQVTDYCHATLKQTSDALAYLQGRGLGNGELIDAFQLGYANKSLTYWLPPSHTVAGKDVRGQLQRLGVLRASGHERFNGCLVVPAIGLDDSANAAQSWQVVQLYGWRITTGYLLPTNEPRHLYLPRPLAGVWNEAALVADQEIILCEALIDAMAFWCAGHRNVIAYDRDDAGNAAVSISWPLNCRTLVSSFSVCCSQRDGCERIRTEGGACSKESRHRSAVGRMVG